MDNKHVQSSSAQWNSQTQIALPEDDNFTAKLPQEALLNQECHKKTKQRVIGSMCLIFLTYRLIFRNQLTSPGSQQCIRDLSHTLTQSLNDKINQGGEFYYWFMIIGQVLIDFNILLFNIYQLFRIQNFFITSWTVLFYGVRGILLQLDKFPYPTGIYWDAPGFPPSLGVPYGITRDFFYSGHTGMLVFCCLFWGLKKETKILQFISFAGLPYIILVVISTRVHYFIDVFAGFLFAVYFFKYARVHLSKFDRFFSAFAQVGQYLYAQIRKLNSNKEGDEDVRPKNHSDIYIKV